MKKRIIALALCLVMLLGCLGMASDSLITSGEDTAPVKAANENYTESVFDASAAKEQLLACESAKAADEFVASLSESQAEALMELVTEEEIRALANRLGIDLDEEIVTPAVNYTSVGALMPAVSTNTAKKLMRAPAKQSAKTEGLELSKTAVYDPDTNTTKITLEAYTTGTVTTADKSVPVDVVLVLDESGSMSDPINQYTKVYNLNNNKEYYVKSGDSYIKVSHCDGGLFQTHNSGWYTGFHFGLHWGTRYDPMTSSNDSNPNHVQFYQASATTTSKRDALVKAANDFADKVYADAEKNNVDHRMSVIGFSNNNASTIKVGLVNDIRNNVNDVKSAIDRLATSGGTYIEDGLTNAKTAFDKASSTTVTERKRVVVIFTDGIPGSGSWSSDTISESANPAINTSYELKNTYGATVYTIGMLDDANPELEISDERDNAARTNKFLHYLSSNYPNATSMDNGGRDGGNKGYYLSASDTASLSSIFEKIYDEIATPSIPLDGNAVIKDIVTPNFNVPENTADIKLYTDEFNGTSFKNERKSATGVTAEIDGDTIKVTGFDYNANFVSDKQHDGTFGKKLIIEFTVTPKDGFLGGNGIYTNGETSGLYQNNNAESALGTFERPTVDIPIKSVTVTAENKNVYLLNDLTADQLKDGVTVNCGNVPLDLSANNYGLEYWQTEYVDITVTYKDEDGNTVTALNDLLDDTTYNVTVTVSPKSSGTATEKTGTATATVNVFKPEITYQDSAIDLGDTANYLTQNFVKVEWKNAAGELADVNKMDSAPELVYTYNPDKGAFKSDTTVEITEIKISGKPDDNIRQYAKFVFGGCEFNGCDNPTAGHGDWKFVVHIKTFDLTIKKDVKNGTDENQKFIFSVMKDGELVTKVVLKGNDSVTIKGLPVGTYTITEDTNWSWRYKLEGIVDANGDSIMNDDGSSCTYTAVAGTNQVTFTNNLLNTKWLTFVDNVKNIFEKN